MRFLGVVGRLAFAAFAAALAIGLAASFGTRWGWWNYRVGLYAIYPYSLYFGAAALLLGSAETVDSMDLFRVMDKKLCIFRKRNVPTREPRLPVFPLTRMRPLGDGALRIQLPEALPYGSLHQQMVEQYAPPSVLVSPDNFVVHFSEHAGRYLVHPGGEPTDNILKLVRK